MVLRSDDGLKALAFVGLILAGLVYWGYRQFRHGGVVEEGTGRKGSVRKDDLATTVKGFMEHLE